MTTSSTYTVGTYNDGTPCNIGDVVKCSEMGRTLWVVLDRTPYHCCPGSHAVECVMVGCEGSEPVPLDVDILTLIERR